MALGDYYGTGTAIYKDLREVLEDKYSQMLLYKTVLTGVNLKALGMVEQMTGFRQYITIVDDLPVLTGKDEDLGATKKMHKRKTAFEKTKYTPGVGYERRVLSTSSLVRTIPIPDLAYKEVLASLNVNMECINKLSNVLALENDYRVVSALLGTAEVLPPERYDGEGTTASNIALDDKETIKKEGGKIDLLFLLQIQQKFNLRYLLGQPIYILCNEYFITDLLQIKEVISADFNVVKPLVNGMVYQFLNMQFIPVPSKILGGAGTKDDPHIGIALTPGAFKYGDKMRKFAIYEAQDYNLEPAIHLEANFGCVRTDEKRVIKLTHTLES